MSYKIIFTDFNMPVMDGLEFTRFTRKFLDSDMKMEREAQPIMIGVTGQADYQLTSKMKKLGLDHLYMKPLYYQDIQEIIKQYIEIQE